MEVKVIKEIPKPKPIKNQPESTEKPDKIEIVIKEKEITCQIISGYVNYII